MIGADIASQPFIWRNYDDYVMVCDDGKLLELNHPKLPTFMLTQFDEPL